MVTVGMLPRAAVREVEARLRAAGCPDADFDAAELFRLAAGGDARLADAPLGAEQAERLEAMTARRASREPLQYLCGSWPFLDFEVTSLEKSPAAYRYLEQNAHLSPALTITPVQGDLFTYWQTLPEGQLDLIVSNPPYLTSAEMGALQPEVAQEPAMALEAGEDGLVFYRAIAEHYQKALRPGGALALEIGWQQREAVTALLAANGWTEIVCRKDFGGNDRCVMARKQ